MVWIEWVNRHICGVGVPLLLLGAGLLFLFRLYPVLLKRPAAALFLLQKQGAKKREALRALCMALSGTLGVGNISGVSLAIALGGAGAVFWMWVSALLAMLLKYAEILLAMAHRPAAVGGVHTGGAMYYIKRALPGRTGKAVAGLFAFLCVGSAFSLGAMVQSGAIAECMKGVLHIPPLLSGILLFAITALVVCGGAERISALTLRLIPAMTLIYVGLSMAVILTNITSLPGIFCRILSDAFSPLAIGGGVGGFLTCRGVRYGVARGLLSNEAGCGTAPMAHATADNTPVAQGLWGIVEVFVDTLVLCSMTAFVVLLAFPAVPVYGGAMLAIAAYSHFFGRWAGWMITLSLFVFAYGTAICWAYYGESGLLYLLGGKAGKRVRYGYYLLFCLFLLAGAVWPSELIFGLTDLLLSAMTLINVTVLCLLSGQVKAYTAKELGLLPLQEKRRLPQGHLTKS